MTLSARSRTTWSIVLAGCTTMNGVLSHPTADASPAAGAGSSKESWWRKVQLDSANGKGEWAPGGHEDGHMNRSHTHVVENCGHDIQVVFDWKTFDMNHWIDVQKKQQRPDDFAAGLCSYEMIYELGSACAADSPLKPYQRDAIKQLKTLTCHYRPCREMPDTPDGSPGRQDVMTYAILAIGAGGSNLDMTYCESESNTTVNVNKWMRAL